MDKPLQGIRVIEISGFLAGPMCGVMLASFGAEVVKVEPPGTGEPSRSYAPYVGPHGFDVARSDDDVSAAILKRTRGKKCITLNLKAVRGRELLLQLACKADVILENMQPGTLAKFGADYDAVRAINPAVVYCSISGFGQTGPLKNKVAFDPIIQAMSGVLSVNGPDSPPTKNGVLLADTVAPIFAALAILAALRTRERTGLGQYVDVSMLDCLLALLFEEMPDYHFHRGESLRQDNRVRGMSPADTYASRDGYVYITAVTDPQWHSLLRAIGAAQEIDNPDFASRPLRWDHRQTVDELVGSWARQRTTGEIVAILDQHEVPCGPVRTISDILTDEHIAARGSLVPLRHPQLDEPLPLLAAAFPARFSGIDTSLAPGRKLGMDNDDIYSNLLGLDASEIAQLAKAGVI